MPSTERDRHRAFFTGEFDTVGFLKDDRFDLREALMDELVDTVLAPEFEGSCQTYGALIMSHSIMDFIENLPPHERVDDGPEARTSCDGVHVFRYSTIGERGLLVFRAPIIDELSLFSLRDDALFKNPGLSQDDPPESELYAVKRFEDGTISVLCREGIATYRSARWRFFRYQYDYKEHLLQELKDLGDWDKQVVNSMLRVLVHMLCPVSGVGATIVLLHAKDQEMAARSKRINPLLNLRNSLNFSWPFKITIRAHQQILVNLLKTTDGATIIDSEGFVQYVRSWLNVDMAKDSTERGTRHLTAKVFSEHIAGLVFTVSSDGPVSVYRSGRRVLTTSDVNPRPAL